jgi:hypothetical protein
VSATIDEERPTATVTVVKGKLNDTLAIQLKHVKPGLAFDLFTMEQPLPFDWRIGSGVRKFRVGLVSV